eukprot:gene2179-8026_t
MSSKRATDPAAPTPRNLIRTITRDSGTVSQSPAEAEDTSTSVRNRVSSQKKDANSTFMGSWTSRPSTTTTPAVQIAQLRSSSVTTNDDPTPRNMIRDITRQQYPDVSYTANTSAISTNVSDVTFTTMQGTIFTKSMQYVSPKQGTKDSSVSENLSNDVTTNLSFPSSIAATPQQLPLTQTIKIPISSSDLEKQVGSVQQQKKHQEPLLDIDAANSIIQEKRQQIALRPASDRRNASLLLQQNKTPRRHHRTTRTITSSSKEPSILPSVSVRHIMKSAISMQMTPAAYEATSICLNRFTKQVVSRLRQIAETEGKHTIEMADIESLFMRQGLAPSKQSLRALIHNHLPMELVEQLLPSAIAENELHPMCKRAKLRSIE